jgi:hypothetical protein
MDIFSGRLACSDWAAIAIGCAVALALANAIVGAALFWQRARQHAQIMDGLIGGDPARVQAWLFRRARRSKRADQGWHAVVEELAAMDRMPGDDEPRGSGGGR